MITIKSKEYDWESQVYLLDDFQTVRIVLEHCTDGLYSNWLQANLIDETNYVLTYWRDMDELTAKHIEILESLRDELLKDHKNLDRLKGVLLTEKQEYLSRYLSDSYRQVGEAEAELDSIKQEMKKYAEN